MENRYAYSIISVSVFCQSVRLSVRLSVCPSVCLSVHLSVRPHVRLSVCLSVCLPACLSVCLFVSGLPNRQSVMVSQIVCLSACLSVPVIVRLSRQPSLVVCQVSAVASWDSSVHENAHLNKATSDKDRIYLVLKVSCSITKVWITSVTP